MWIDDGSGAIQPADGPYEFTVRGKQPGDGPVNARFSQALESGDYFEVDLLEIHDSASVGITTERGFAPSYRCKGLFLCGPGNLSDGCSLRLGGFGSSVSAGTTVGVLVELSEATAMVTFYQAGRCLGKAFVAERSDPGAAIFPVVSCRADGDRVAIRFPPAPDARERQAAPKAHPAAGRWLLKRLCIGPELGEVPAAELVGMGGGRVSLQLHPKGPNTGSLSLKVGNNLFTEAEWAPDPSLSPFESLKLGRLATTLMMAPPSVMDLESKVANAFQSVHKWLVQDKTLLIVGATCELEFEEDPDTASNGPVTSVALA